ncbi:MAG: nitrophenyl compound nitroreductase subunit ArsF family protein [Rikenellaceae bacterium]
MIKLKYYSIAIIFAILMYSCGGNSTHNNTRIKSEAELSRIKSPNTDNIELIFFHSRHHCANCEAIERCTREVVATMPSPDVEMKVIDITTTEGEKIGDIYEVAWTSLILDNKGSISDLTQLGYNCAQSNPDEFKRQLTAIINKSKE